MAKSSYLPRILFTVGLFAGCHTGCIDIAERPKNVNSKKEMPVQPSHARAMRARIKSIYDQQIGVREATGKNDGRIVEQYLRYTGNSKGDPWCAAFVCWVLGRAKVPNPKSGWSPDVINYGAPVWPSKRNQQKHPAVADVFGIWFADKKRVAHVGFVDRQHGNFLVTVEGNTNEAGSREGNGVYFKRRLLKSIYRIVSFVDR